MPNAYALQTWTGTFVCFDGATRSLRHRVAGPTESLVSVTLAGDRLRFSYSGGAPPDPILTRLCAGDFTVAGRAPDQLGFQLDGWLCADATGAVVSDRPSASGWETFRLVPLEEAPFGRVGALAAFPRAAAKPGIPAALHQVFVSQTLGVSLPEALAENIRQLREMNSDFSYHLWTESEVLQAVYEWYGPGVLSLYTRINPRYAAARADLFRYLLIYKEGGVYLDLKSNTTRPLSRIFEPGDGFILSYWSQAWRARRFGYHAALSHMERGEYQQWFLIGEAGHPYLEAVIARVLENIATYRPIFFGTGRLGVLHATGPIPYTLAIQPIVGEHPHRFMEVEAEGLVYQHVTSRPLGRHYAELTEDVVL